MQRGAEYVLLVVAISCQQAHASIVSRSHARAIHIGGMSEAYLAGEKGKVVSGSTYSMQHDDSTSIRNRPDDEAPEHMTQFYLLDQWLNFTVDLSNVGCACNLAVYLVAAPARDMFGEPHSGKWGYYCDANQVGGQWCPEIDLMEANTHAFQATPHSCDAPDGIHHYARCDRKGCSQNTQNMAGAYGPNETFTINTMNPFEVSTRFVSKDGDFVAMQQFLSQGMHGIFLEHESCEAAYLANLTSDLTRGFSLVISYWGDAPADMEWLDAPACGSQSCSATAGEAAISGIATSGHTSGAASHSSTSTTVTQVWEHPPPPPWPPVPAGPHSSEPPLAAERATPAVPASGLIASLPSVSRAPAEGVSAPVSSAIHPSTTIPTVSVPSTVAPSPARPAVSGHSTVAPSPARPAVSGHSTVAPSQAIPSPAPSPLPVVSAFSDMLFHIGRAIGDLHLGSAHSQVGLRAEDESISRTVSTTMQRPLYTSTTHSSTPSSFLAGGTESTSTGASIPVLRFTTPQISTTPSAVSSSPAPTPSLRADASSVPLVSAITDVLAHEGLIGHATSFDPAAGAVPASDASTSMTARPTQTPRPSTSMQATPTPMSTETSPLTATVSSTETSTSMPRMSTTIPVLRFTTAIPVLRFTTSHTAPVITTSAVWTDATVVSSSAPDATETSTSTATATMSTTSSTATSTWTPTATTTSSTETSTSTATMSTTSSTATATSTATSTSTSTATMSTTSSTATATATATSTSTPTTTTTSSTQTTTVTSSSSTSITSTPLTLSWKVDYVLVHAGACAAGWINGQTKRVDSFDTCLARCIAEPSCGYFAYDSRSVAGANCALYTLAGGCRVDDFFPDFRAYRLRKEALYDCDTGIGDYERLWSQAQATWCCEHRQRGCNPEAEVPSPDRLDAGKDAFKCQEGFWNWQATWSLEKRHWCCEHEPHWCPSSQELSWSNMPSRLWETSLSLQGRGPFHVLPWLSFVCAGACGIVALALGFLRRRQKLREDHSYRDICIMGEETPAE